MSLVRRFFFWGGGEEEKNRSFGFPLRFCLFFISFSPSAQNLLLFPPRVRREGGTLLLLLFSFAIGHGSLLLPRSDYSYPYFFFRPGKGGAKSIVAQWNRNETGKKEGKLFFGQRKIICRLFVALYSVVAPAAAHSGGGATSKMI